MRPDTDPVKIVSFVPRDRSAEPVGPAIARTVERLSKLTETILRLERLVADAPPTDPMRLAAARAVATMKRDALRIATALETLLPGVAPAAGSPAPEPERQVGTP